MRLVENEILLANGDMSQASLTSATVPLEWRFVVAVQCVFTGSPVGTIKAQATNDQVTWTDLTGSLAAINSAGDILYSISDIGYPFLRIVYTKVSGSGNLNISATSKGV